MPELVDQRPRRQMIEELVEGALEGMQPIAVHATGVEVCCATLTLALRSLQTVLRHKPECADQMRLAVLPLLLACTGEGASS